MNQFPLNPVTPGRSQYANPRPLAPVPIEPGPQDEPFAGIRNYGDEGSEAGDIEHFEMDTTEPVGASYRVKATQPQSRTPETTQSVSGMGPTGGYPMPPAVPRTD